MTPARLRTAIAALAISIFLAALDTSIANTALPTIAADLRASPASSVWVVTAYQLAVVATLLPLGALGEIVGFRRVYLAGLLVFVAASALCAGAWSLPTLTAARVLQGLGAAGIMSVNTAIVRHIAPPHRLGAAVGLTALIVAVSTALGPSLAALILSVAAWPLLFAINVPIGSLALLLSLALPDTPQAAHRFDAPAAVLNVLAFSALVFGLGEAAHRATPLRTVLALAVAAAAATVLVRRQRGHPAPLLPLDLYRIPLFALSSLTSACSFAAQGLAFVALPFLFQTVLGYTAVETGVLLTPWPVATAVMALVAGPLSDRYPPAILGGTGLSILAGGLVWMATGTEGAAHGSIMAAMAVCGTGFGLFQSPNMRSIMVAAPPGRAGSASSTVATSRLLGQSAGSALVALCFALSGNAGGPALALLLAAAFSACAAVVSLSRLLVR